MQLTATLSTSPALTGFSPAEIAALEEVAMVWDYSVGETVFAQGAEAFGLCIIESGKVGVEIEVGGRIVPLHDLGPGELIGWSGITEPHRFTCTTRCVTDARMIVFRAEDIERFIAENEHLGYALLNNVNRLVSGRLREMQERLAEAIAWYRYCRGYPL